MQPLFRYTLALALLASLSLGLVGHGSNAQTDAQAELVAGNNAFAFDLYRQLITELDGNVIFSPYSISQAFGMVAAGARGDTEQQIWATMRYPLSQDSLHTTFGALNTDLDSRETQSRMEGQQLQLNIANSLWGQDGFPFRETFLATLRDAYASELSTVDFAVAEAARAAINGWVEDQTEDKIQDILPAGVLTPATRLVLVNAIYFNAGWLFPFYESATQEDTFYLLDGDTVTVPMMFQEHSFGYFLGYTPAGDDFQVVELPYFGGDTAMMVILPHEGTFANFEAWFDAEQFDMFRTGLNTLGETPVQLYMPRFEYTTNFSLKAHLIALGMTDAFADTADLTGMFYADQAAGNLYISEALHKAFVGVDELGTEAAAATAVIIALTSAPAPMPEPVELRLDHPFIYVIYDRVTGSILFVGRVLNPAA